MKKMNKDKLRTEVLARVAAECDHELRKHLITDLRQNSYTYRTYGTDVEKPIFFYIQSLLSDLPVEVREAKNKNEFPDIQIYYKGKEFLGIDIKAANRLKRDNKGSWKPAARSANDLANFDSVQGKLDKWGGENIWFIYVEYSARPEVQDIVRTVFDKFYKFVGQMSDGLMSYRKKDGKIRPKKFDEPSPYPTLESFQAGLALTIGPWREKIIRGHLAKLPDDNKQKLLRELQNE